MDLGQDTRALWLPGGTTGQRPTVHPGEIRYNSSTPGIEAYYNSTWNNLGGGGGTTNYQAAIQPQSQWPNSANITYGVYAGGGGGTSIHDTGWQLPASLGTDSDLELRFQMPPNIPSGTFKLLTTCLANATTGTMKYTVKDADVANGASPSAATLSSETQNSVTWTAADVYVQTKTPLTHSTPAANDVSVVDVDFNTSGYTLAQIATCRFVEIWE